ncbi:phosphatidylinositol-specific phospholipase C domain-containing protein [Micromonospora sp. WMMA1363]|uniref:phosphatidylinositol-specific phospholipase C domain-containing protein n=1 Tax=Micromonospora sp. WMMA1363 TaxID=3053985 RepID=UPI00259CCB27|nr:phosphatidylinositol-specific phospholipase C domain-containing protein [Micromonospora sp. WMMA1363]MDM4719444.1 phosphatidylinositol-specific phospholipase C domain-containing protein [Micromonospora sp. WMMA1363]
MIASLAVPLQQAVAAPANDTPLASATTVGIHNTYEQTSFDYLAAALDTGTSMIEIDIWPNIFTQKWKVSHDEPLSNNNNCTTGSTLADLYTGSRNKHFSDCLDNVRVWLDAHPDSGPLMIKIEPKLGLATAFGMGADQIDSLIRSHLGDRVFRPADLLAKPGGGWYQTLDQAARAGNWPTREQLAGRVLFNIIPGTAENRNPFDWWPTNEQYAGHLRNLAAAGKIDKAQIFPTAMGTSGGDPRDRYDATVRPWFVVFDSGASGWLNRDTTWFADNNYLLVMTSAHAVQPAISGTNPTEDEARDRLLLLAAANASIITSDWTKLPQIQSMVVPRGAQHGTA